MEVRQYGLSAWLLAEVDDPAGMRAAVLEALGDEAEDVVAAERSVIVRFRTETAERYVERLSALTPIPSAPETGDVVIPVRYDGPDLAIVAGAAGMTVDEVVAAHVRSDYRVEFCGFSPGFAYLTGLHPGLQVPRRAEPRTQVPAGSVAIAAHYTAVYPAASPGGWHLIGSTGLRLWDAEREPPALLTPGCRVRFEPIER